MEGGYVEWREGMLSGGKGMLNGRGRERYV